MKKFIPLFAVILFASLLLVAGCQKSQPATTGQTPVKVATTIGVKDTTDTLATTDTTAEVKEFKLTAKQFAFEPSTIRVKQGDKVRLVVTSPDVDHGIAIKDFGVSLKIGAGKTESVEFVAGTVGTFSFYCNVQCGSGHGGMRGQLIVE